MCTWEGENWTAEKRSGETEEEEGRHGRGNAAHVQITASILP